MTMTIAKGAYISAVIPLVPNVAITSSMLECAVRVHLEADALRRWLARTEKRRPKLCIARNGESGKMNKNPTQKPSRAMEHIKIRVLAQIPVLQACQPVVGKVYDAINGVSTDHGKSTHGCCQFCVIDVAGKKVVLRNKTGFEKEYEVVTECG